MLRSASHRTVLQCQARAYTQGGTALQRAAAGRQVALRRRPAAAHGGQQQRTLFKWLGRKRLAKMEEEADRQGYNAHKQSELMRELNKFDPEATIQRFESSRYAADEAVVKEYIHALVKLGRLDRANLPEAMRRAGAHQAGAASAGGGGGQQAVGVAQAAGGGGGGGQQGMLGSIFTQGPSAAAAAANGGSRDPVHVVMSEPGVRSQLWKTVRFAGISFLLFSGASAMMEDRGISGGLAGLGGSKDQNEPVDASDTRFSDVKGVDEAKAELEEVVSFLRAPEKFTRLGGKLPKGLLLTGPPGTGKTLLARAIAGEAGVPFFYASGSEFEEMFVGVGARRVRDLFASAKKKQPCIIFIDEIDAIGGKRNPKDQHYMKMTLNQLLVELDGFAPTDGVIVVGATNFPESLDKALVRPGRFDRHVVVPTPDVEGRRQILELYLEKIPMGPDILTATIARGTSGFSGAELSNLVNMAALKAAQDDKEEVSMADLEFAKDKIIMGAERKSAVISDSSKKLTAFHEGGHALMAIKTKGATPVHKATIMPRGQALGMVTQLPSTDETSISKLQLIARLDVCMGGRVAEELIFGADSVTTGASSDLDQATNIAHAMVTRYGMSDKIGPVALDLSDGLTVSTDTRRLVEEEVRIMLDASYKRTIKTLESHKVELHKIANALLEHETLSGDELNQVLKGKMPPGFDLASQRASQRAAKAAKL